MLTLDHITLTLRSLSHSLLKSESNGYKIDVNLLTSTIYVQFQILLNKVLAACLTFHIKFNFLQKTKKGKTEKTCMTIKCKTTRINETK